ncbi:MAG: glycosyltransferase family 2 protein, partial [Candidatus Binatia bacterium]
MYTELSIVVCTRNRAGSLVRCLEAVAAQSAPFGFETVVVDNGSTDDTRARVEALAARARTFRYVYEPRPG